MYTTVCFVFMSICRVLGCFCVFLPFCVSVCAYLFHIHIVYAFHNILRVGESMARTYCFTIFSELTS